MIRGFSHAPAASFSIEGLGDLVEASRVASTTTVIASLLALSGGCAPPGHVYNAGSFIPRPIDKPVVETLAASPTPTRLSQQQMALILGPKPPPPISDCASWKEISRRVAVAATTNPDVRENDFAGDTIREAQRRGWPLNAAKQLFVALLAAQSARSNGEAHFVDQQYKDCLEVAAKPGPKYANVSIGFYDTPEQRAKGKRDPEEVQDDYLVKQQRLQPCIQYRAQASMVSVYKQNGFSLEQAQAELSLRAYGPGGIVYRGSRETEAMLVRLARAGYEGNPTSWTDEYGQPTRDFGEYAYAMCMKGAPF